MSKIEIIRNGKWKRKKENRFLIRWLVNTCSLFVTAGLVGGITLGGLFEGLIAALLLCVVNTYIRPVLIVLSLPFTILTLGLFTFVVNGLMLLLTAGLLSGFAISGFWTAFWGAILISIFNLFFTTIIE